MKTYIKNTLLVGAVSLGMMSCSENSWNDHLDGFTGGPDFSNVQTLDYTLEVSDYELIAKNSANKALAESAGVADELKAVGSLGYLNDKILPAEYIPNLLQDPGFKYFTLSGGSSINVTYRIAKNLPEEMVNMNAASSYTVTKEDYQEAYGSEEDYAESFSPMATAAGNIPGILKSNFPDAAAGEYVLVNYNNSETSPVFNTPEDTFEPSDILKDAKAGDDVTVNGVVTGVCARGFIFSDKGASVLVYLGSSYDGSYVLGDRLEISGTVGVNNNGLQFGESATIKKVGLESSVTYPAAKVYTGADMDAAIQTTDNFTAVYCSITGKVSVSGNYYNLMVDGASTSQGSFYMLTDAQKAMLKDGETCTVNGYFVSISKSGGVPKFFNILLTGVESSAKSPANVKRRVATIANTAVSSLYLYDGSKWAPATDVTVLQPSDYKQMGVSGNALTADEARTMIPMFLSRTYPYAAAETSKYVLYSLKGSDGTSLRSVEYTYDGTQWVDSISEEGVITETNQFVFKSSGWKMDPSISLVLPRGKNQATSMWFYQAAVDWVSANIENASSWVDSYGTGEYYSGCSAYQGNVNINSSYATLLSYYPGVQPEEIVKMMKSRFEHETGPGALSLLYPNMAPIEGLEPTVTVTFTAWTTGGANVEYTIVWKCVEKGKFEFVSCTWNDAPAE